MNKNTRLDYLFAEFPVIFSRMAQCKRTLALAITMLFGLLFVSGPLHAVTADGVTPANEGVCDVLQGATPGLYGLCNAYCEAQDLDLVGDKEPPNNKILANYRKKMRAGDPDMPCLQVACPCWSSSELAAVTSGSSLSCVQDATSVLIRNTSPNQFASMDLDRAMCRFTDTAVEPKISRRFNQLNQEEAQGCFNQLVSACSANAP